MIYENFVKKVGFLAARKTCYQVLDHPTEMVRGGRITVKSIAAALRAAKVPQIVLDKYTEVYKHYKRIFNQKR